MYARSSDLHHKVLQLSRSLFYWIAAMRGPSKKQLLFPWDDRIGILEAQPFPVKSFSMISSKSTESHTVHVKI